VLDVLLGVLCSWVLDVFLGVLCSGDQTLCCRAVDLRRVGGYDSSWVIMEDADLCVRMHEAGPTPAPAPAATGTIATGATMAAAAAAGGATAAAAATCAITAAAGGGTAAGSSTGGAFRPSGNKRCCNGQWSASRGAGSEKDSKTGSSVNGSSSKSALVNSWEGFCDYIQWWCRPRGRVVQVLDRVNVTSGRRLAAWGNWKGTAIHVVLGVSWYFGKDPQQLYELYHRMYTDNLR
jgi:hypothetical protein